VALLVIMGVIGLWRDSKTTIVFILWLPLAFAWAASALGKYPLAGRFLLFLVPSAILTIAYGVATLLQRTRNLSQWIAGVIVVFLLFQSANLLTGRLPRYREEIKPVLGYIEDHYLPGDQVYVYWAAKPAFLFYAGNRFDNNYLFGLKSFRDPSAYIADMNRVCGLNRVWVLFSSVYGQERTFFLRYLDGVGIRRDQIEEKGSFAYLYDLSGVDCSAY
jgi:4-amino-4-deoxy-L-arabinose transferase-like glycosyltransferase